MNQLDSIIEANNSIESQQNQDASSIPNYFVDLRSNKAVPLSQSFINTLNNYIYEQQGSYLYKDKKFAAYVLLTDRLATINTDDLLLYFQGLNKVNKLDDINTASVKSLQEAYYGVYGRPKFKFEPIVYPSETVQNVANKPVVTSYKPVETAHDLAIQRIAKLSKISQSDKLGILLGIDLTYGTPSMQSKLSSNSPASAKIEVNTSVAVDKRMAPELSSSIKSDLNAEELYMSYAYKTLEAKIKGKTETLFQIVKGFNSPNAVYKAELELYLQSFELKAAQYQLSAKDISDKLTDQHLQEINASQLLRLLTLTYKFQKWDGNADGLVVWILKKIPQKHAYQLYKYLDYKPKGQTYIVLAHWHDNIRPGTFDVESDMGDMNQALKSLLKKIPISAFAQELKEMSQDAVRNLNIDYDYPENKCNDNPSLLSPKFSDASFDAQTGEVSIDYYGIDVSMKLKTCCDKIIRPSGTPAPQCYYFDHRLSTRQSTRTLGATQLVCLTDFSDGSPKVYYMPSYFLANLTVNARQKVKEARVWLMVEVAVTALTWEMGGEPGIAMFLARTSAVTGLVSTSAAVAANLGNESMPESLKNSLNSIATSAGLVSLGTGVGSFVAYYRAASKTIASGKLASLQKASENLQDELNTAIQHADELGISPTDLEKYKGALSELQANYANVFNKAYEPKLLAIIDKITASIGKVITGGDNLLDLPAPVGIFKQLIGKDKKTYRAADFWKETGKDFLHNVSSDGKYYLKCDPVSGRMLLVDVVKKEFVGYFLDEGFGKLTVRHYNASNIATAIEDIRLVYGLSSKRSVTLSGYSVPLRSDKTNVFMGSFYSAATPSSTTEALSKTKYLANYDFGARKGGIQLLNVPDEMYRTSTDFWDEYNLPWLKGLADLSDVEFTVLSDLTDLGLMYRHGILSGFGKEVTTLLKRGDLDLYYDATLGMHKFVKKGEVVLPNTTIDAEVREHIIKGATNGTQASGCHYPLSVDGINVRYANGALDNSSFVKDVNGVYEAEIEIKKYTRNPDKSIQKNPDGTDKFRWITKYNNSTFFPDHWDENQIINAIEFAYSNKKLIGTKGQWLGISREGIIIEGFIDLSTSKIKTAYPKIVK